MLWVKNAANQALTAADFNAALRRHLTAGTDLVEMYNAGMANAGPRGIQVATNTGHEISRADYMTDAETVADTPIQYAWDSSASPTTSRPGRSDGRGGRPTPGYTDPTQVPAGLVATRRPTRRR